MEAGVALVGGGRGRGGEGRHGGPLAAPRTAAAATLFLYAERGRQHIRLTLINQELINEQSKIGKCVTRDDRQPATHLNL